MASKYLLVTFSNRITYKIPASLIAGSRADYYARIDADRGDGDYDANYITEYQLSIKDDSLLEEWAKNSMNWEDVYEYAELYEDNDISHHDEWCNAEMDFIGET